MGLFVAQGHIDFAAVEIHIAFVVVQDHNIEFVYNMSGGKIEAGPKKMMLVNVKGTVLVYNKVPSAVDSCQKFVYNVAVLHNNSKL